MPEVPLRWTGREVGGEQGAKRGGDVKANARYRYRLRVGSSEAVKLGAVFSACRATWDQALGSWGGLWREEGLAYHYRDADRDLTD